MICCLDVHYFGDLAGAAALVFPDWSASTPAEEHTATASQPGDFDAGRFYLRELQPLLAVIATIEQPIGLDYREAARLVESMAGEFRIPTLLKAVDRLARTPES